MFDKYLLIFVDFICEKENEKHINDSVVASIAFSLFSISNKIVYFNSESDVKRKRCLNIFMNFSGECWETFIE